MRIMTVLIFSLLVLGRPALAERKVSEEATLFRNLRAGVFTVLSEDGKGTGFLVDDRGLVATNAHVVGSSRRIAVQVNDSTKVAAFLCAVDKTEDVAVLRIAPSVCGGLPVLPLRAADLELAMEGERVIAIGSPLNQERILTTGIVSKVESKAIISDVNINHGNSGGPLINMDGEVIAINTFGDFTNQGGPGISGCISIRVLDKTLQRAVVALRETPPPPEKRLPVMPHATYPLETLKRAALVEQWNVKPYNVKAGNYTVSFLTPPYVYNQEKQHELALAKNRGKKSADASTSVEYDPFSELKSWSQYLGELTPTVTLQVMPKIGETGGSVFKNILGAALAGASGSSYYGSHKYEFKADLNDFDLCAGDSTIADIQRGMTWQPLDFAVAGWGSSSYGSDLARAGVFIYGPDVFQPSAGGWPKLLLHVHSEKDPEHPEEFVVPQETLEAVAMDFDAYYWSERAKNAVCVVAQ